MTPRWHLSLFLQAVGVWAAFWLLGLPDYYQQYSTVWLAVGSILLSVGISLGAILVLRGVRDETRMSRALWLSLYFTAPLAALDSLYCGWYLGHGADYLVEPNGNTDNPDLIAQRATPLEGGVAATGYIASEGDDDWYVVEVLGAGTLRVDLDNEPAVASPVDYELRVFAADAETQAGETEVDLQGDDATTRLHLTVNVQPGTWFLQVRDFEGQDDDYGQPYHLMATVP